MVCEKMLFLFLLGTFVTVLFCHFPFLGGVPSGPRSPRARASPRARGPARARGVFGLVVDLSPGKRLLPSFFSLFFSIDSELTYLAIYLSNAFSIIP